MKKLSISLLLLLGLAGCGTVTGLTVHKNDLHALIEKDNEKCIVQFNNTEGQKYKDVKTNFTCDQVKYFNESNK
jgi:hypothetical protein